MLLDGGRAGDFGCFGYFGLEDVETSTNVVKSISNESSRRFSVPKIVLGVQ